MLMVVCVFSFVYWAGRLVFFGEGNLRIWGFIFWGVVDMNGRTTGFNVEANGVDARTWRVR